MTTTPIPDVCAPAWGHATGHLAIVGPQPVANDIRTLADRDFARETALRYSYAYDERRLDMLKELLTPNARFSISIGGGAEQTVNGKETVIQWLSDIMDSQSDQRRHVISNVLVEELTASTALIVTYLAIFAVEQSAQLATTGFYRFELLKSDNVWLVDHIFDGLDRPF